MTSLNNNIIFRVHYRYNNIMYIKSLFKVLSLSVEIEKTKT